MSIFFLLNNTVSFGVTAYYTYFSAVMIKKTCICINTKMFLESFQGDELALNLYRIVPLTEHLQTFYNYLLGEDACNL